MGIEYKKEFFDRDYTIREAYGRAWRYARKYKVRIFAGILCGMLTAGTLVPIFTVVKPALEKVSRTEMREKTGVGNGCTADDSSVRSSTSTPDFDILVMGHGQIVERGTHDELYAAGGAYRKLCDMQHQN